MTIKKHKKHVALSKPSGGKFHDNELAFIGAPCDVIQRLCADIAKHLSPATIGFIDVDHATSEIKTPFYSTYTDIISHHQLQFQQSNIDFEFRKLMNDTSMVLVNGNHYGAVKQAVFIHPKKKESLQRKLDRLTDVQFFILAEGETDIYYFLKDENPKWNELPKFSIHQIEKISQFIRDEFIATLPKINGLVLAGGESMRMGEDKSKINYHGKPQAEFLADLLSKFCDEVFISTQNEDNVWSYPQIKDTFTGLGPFGGIVSAFRHEPNRAWLTVATDIPFLNDDVIAQLIEQRDAGKVATCFHNRETGFPEPLITIWEPRAYAHLLHFLSIGYSCPRKVLINSNIHEVMPVNEEALFNANTPEEKNKALNKING